MEEITIRDTRFRIFIPYEQIETRIKELARQINEEYADKNPLFLGVLNGAFIFASDLFKMLEIDCGISFVKVASYDGTSSSKDLRSLIGIEENLEGRHVILLEDIVDTGYTLTQVLPQLKERKPASLKVMTLLSKPDAMEHNVKVDYVGFEIPNDFIVGYGLDYDGLGRNYKDIYQLVL